MADIKEIKKRLAFWQKVEDEGGSPTSARKLAVAKAELADAEDDWKEDDAIAEANVEEEE
tara:strand:- start:302 stop:481 length:180 start_codon:yes stop_codon:yes gene_type:complete